MKKLLAIFLSLVFLISAVPAYADGDTENPEPAPVPSAAVEPIEDSGYDAAFSFNLEEGGESEYDSCIGDFTVSFNSSLSAGAVKLAISFDGYNEGEWDEFEIPDVQAEEEISLLDRVIEATEHEGKYTYSEIADSIGNFRIAATGIDAYFTEMTVKFNVYQNDGETVSAITCGEAQYTFPGDATVPTATVKSVKASGLETAYSFTPDQTYEQVLKSSFKDYKADFEITFDKDIAAGDIKFAYAYPDNNGGKFVIFDAPEINAGEKYSILDKLIADNGRSGNLTYSGVVDAFKSLSIGASSIEAEYNINMSIEFNLYENEKSTTPVTVARQTYTFLDDGITEIKLNVKNNQDIAPELEAAFKRAKDVKNRKYIVRVPAGSYKTTSQVHIYSNTTLDLTAGVKIVHNDTDSKDSPMFRFMKKTDFESANGGKGYKGYSAGGNIAIIGGTLDGGGNTQAIFKFGHARGVTLDGVTMCNVKQKHYVEFAASENVTIKNCKFTDFKGPWGGNSNAEALQIDAAVYEHFSGFASNTDETPSRNITITKNTFKGLKRGVGSHSLVATSFNDNVNITNNTFEDIEGYAIIASNYRNCKITGNTIKNCGSGIMFTTSGTSESNFYQPRAKKYTKQSAPQNMNAVIENNKITVNAGNSKANFVNTGYGIQLLGATYTASQSKSIRSKKKNNYVCPEGDFRASGVTVRNNTIAVNCSYYGIWLQGAFKNTVTNNVITTNVKVSGVGGTGDGIRASESSYNTISNNKFTNITTNGKDSDMFGINLIDSSSSNTVSGNTVSGMKKDGIKIEGGSNNVVTGNIISNAGRDGLHLVSANSTYIKNNTVSSKRYGVSAENSAKVSVISNKFNKTGGLVFKKSKSAKIDSNTIAASKNDGIKLEKSNSAVVNKNIITSAKRDGINIVGSKKITITGNTIKSSKRYGINAKKNMIKKDKKNKIKKSKKRARSWKKK